MILALNCLESFAVESVQQRTTSVHGNVRKGGMNLFPLPFLDCFHISAVVFMINHSLPPDYYYINISVNATRNRKGSQLEKFGL